MKTRKSSWNESLSSEDRAPTHHRSGYTKKVGTHCRRRIESTAALLKINMKPEAAPDIQNDFEINPSPELDKRGCKRVRRDSDSGNETDIFSPAKLSRSDEIDVPVHISDKEIRAFLKLVEDPVICGFLDRDSCYKNADKYLLAMVFIYFKRAWLKIREYNRRNFFIALYLACDMEEDDEEFKYEIFPWALGYGWVNHYAGFLKKKDKFWKRLEYRAIVSKAACDKVMKMYPDHWLWKRERPLHHAGATRHSQQDEDSDDGYPRGPDATPRRCDACAGQVQHDSAGPFHEADDRHSWYLSSSADSSPEMPGHTRCKKSTRIVSSSWLDMEGLRKTLAAAEDEIWAHKEE